MRTNCAVSAIGKTRTQLLELKAEKLGVTAESAPLIAKLREQDNQWKVGTISARQYRQALRMLPAQFTDIFTSIAGGMPLWLVLFQQGGQISDSFGGLGGIFRYIKEELLGMKGATNESNDSLSESANSLADNAQNARGLASILTPARLGMIGLAGAGALVTYHFYKASDRAEQLRKSLAMTNSFSGLCGVGMMGWIGQTGGTVANGQTVAMPPKNISTGKYDAGGYTGDGGKYEPASVVHRGEFVMTKEATQRIGVDNLYAMMRGYATGGFVGNTVADSAPMHGFRGSEGAQLTINAPITLNQQGQQQDRS